MSSPQDQQSCTHKHAKITFFTELGYSYTLHEGIAGEEYVDNEPTPSMEMTVWCPDCSLDAYYEDWEQAPEPLYTYARHIRIQYWDEEDDGSFRVLVKEG